MHGGLNFVGKKSRKLRKMGTTTGSASVGRTTGDHGLSLVVTWLLIGCGATYEEYRAVMCGALADV